MRKAKRCWNKEIKRPGVAIQEYVYLDHNKRPARGSHQPDRFYHFVRNTCTQITKEQYWYFIEEWRC